MNVSVLFSSPLGPYPNMGLDCWGEDRDARKFTGDNPVIAHPPCGRWCGMAHLNERRWGAKVGEDDGCFEFALRTVIKNGGVLEHPAFSLAWGAYGLEAPRGIGWYGSMGIWVAEVWQSAYGHKARKRTWLLYAGDRPPSNLDWSRPKGTHQIGGGVHTGNRLLPRISSLDAIATPQAFAVALVGLASSSRARRFGWS